MEYRAEQLFINNPPDEGQYTIVATRHEAHDTYTWRSVYFYDSFQRIDFWTEVFKTIPIVEHHQRQRIYYTPEETQRFLHLLHLMRERYVQQVTSKIIWTLLIDESINLEEAHFIQRELLHDIYQRYRRQTQSCRQERRERKVAQKALLFLTERLESRPVILEKAYKKQVSKKSSLTNLKEQTNRFITLSKKYYLSQERFR
jgi:hypothetical protein